MTRYIEVSAEEAVALAKAGATIYRQTDMGYYYPSWFYEQIAAGNDVAESIVIERRIKTFVLVGE